jgi:DNA-binding MarR family transcriptional regulator
MTGRPALPDLDAIATGCACFNLRRAARAITQLYDHALAPAGLRATQFTVLVALARTGAIPFSRLAAALGMDRTTLTRNLGPIQRHGLVAIRPGPDRRVRLVEMTAAGHKALDDAIPLWSGAQRQIVEGAGPGRWEAVRREVQRIAALAGNDA